MAQALTDRQKQIKDLLEAGNKADAIAKKLKITPNAVYQQIRRMRNAGNAPKGVAQGKGGRKSAGKKRAAAKPAATPSPAPAPVSTEPRLMTPLQALRARRDEIEARLKAAHAEVETHERAAAKARESAEKLTVRHNEELGQLDAAEAALKGEKPKPAPRKTSGKKGGGKASPAKPAQEAPAPAPADPAPAPAETPQPPPVPPQEPAAAPEAAAPADPFEESGNGAAAPSESTSETGTTPEPATA